MKKLKDVDTSKFFCWNENYSAYNKKNEGNIIAIEDNSNHVASNKKVLEIWPIASFKMYSKFIKLNFTIS